MNENNLSISRGALASLLHEQYEQFRSKDRGIPRAQLATVRTYLPSPHIIVLSGLRRSGKSTLLLQVTDYLENDSYYYVNFEDERLAGVSAQELNSLYQTLIEEFGERDIFLFDEIQNVEKWEFFIRRLHEAGKKCVITGSNASLLSKELGTKLTGRHLVVELFPFSLSEYAQYRSIHTKDLLSHMTTRKRAHLNTLVRDYISDGGIPEHLNYPDLPVHQSLYQDILYRDIAVRYDISDTLPLRELAQYLISNVGHLVSFNKLKERLKLGSVNTVSSYIDHFCNSWLLFTMNVYDYSIKRQQIAPKKLYTIDSGLAQSVGFGFSANYGKWMENTVFLHERRKGGDIYYYKTKHHYELDFYIPSRGMLIQVSQTLAQKETRERELRALQEAMKELRCEKGYIVTEDEYDDISGDGVSIGIRSMYSWLLEER